MILVDTNVLLDLITDDPVWGVWSQQQLETASLRDQLVINDVIYGELSIRYARIEDLDKLVSSARLNMQPIPKAALFLAGKAFQRYRASGGSKSGVLPDFFIGAHAAVTGSALLTRDSRRYRSYFPDLRLIAPS